jgi:hypothetical protein
VQDERLRKGVELYPHDWQRTSQYVSQHVDVKPDNDQCRKHWQWMRDKDQKSVKGDAGTLVKSGDVQFILEGKDTEEGFEDLGEEEEEAEWSG